MGIRHKLAEICFPASLEMRALRRNPPPWGIVLMYHEVLPDDVDIPSWLIVRQSDFERQMRHLKRHFDVLPMDTAIRRLSGDESVTSGRPIAVITFDDGYAGNLTCALPVLKSLELPFTVYISTSRIADGGRYWYDDVICTLIAATHTPVTLQTSRGVIRYTATGRNATRRWPEINAILSMMKNLPAEERQAVADEMANRHALPVLRMMTPEEVKRLSDEELATIGNHTHGHDLLDQLSTESAAGTIGQAQRLLEAWTGRRPVHFSYPNGNYTPDTLQLVRRLGLSSAVTTRPDAWLPVHNPFEIPRIGIGRFDNLNLFRAKACGLLD